MPIIRKEMQSFLKVLLKIQKPMCILEVGTTIGFCSYNSEQKRCRITTIENYQKRIPIARRILGGQGKQNRLTLIEGDAMEVLKTLEGQFGFFLWMLQKEGVLAISAGSAQATLSGWHSCNG